MIPKPMLLVSGPLRPDHERYAFEVKWDGFRALVSADSRSLHVTSRNGHDVTDRYREMQALRSQLKQNVILDGEIVRLDEDGKPDFAALWFRSRSQSNASVCFMIFDLLQLGDESLIGLPYSHRRKRLEELELSGPNWCTTDYYIGEGSSLFTSTKEMGLEGVVAKRMDSRYRPGIRSRAWTKTKHFRTETFGLMGWLPPEERRHQERGGVVAGFVHGSQAHYAGLIESGVTREIVERLPHLTRRDFRAMSAGTPTEPSLLADISYLEWSPAGGLRHASLVRGSYSST